MSGQSLQRLSDFLYPRAATSSSPKKAVGSLKIKIHSTVNHVLHSQHKVHAVVKQGVAIPTLTRAALSIAFIFFFLFIFFPFPSLVFMTGKEIAYCGDCLGQRDDRRDDGIMEGKHWKPKFSTSLPGDRGDVKENTLKM